MNQGKYVEDQWEGKEVLMGLQEWMKWKIFEVILSKVDRKDSQYQERIKYENEIWLRRKINTITILQLFLKKLFYLITCI